MREEEEQPSLCAALFKRKSSDDETTSGRDAGPDRPQLADAASRPSRRGTPCRRRPRDQGSGTDAARRAGANGRRTYQLASADRQSPAGPRILRPRPTQAGRNRRPPLISSMPAASGATRRQRRPGLAGPGRRACRRARRWRRRSAADRQRYRASAQTLAYAPPQLAGRARQYRHGQRADPAQRAPGSRAPAGQDRHRRLKGARQRRCRPRRGSPSAKPRTDLWTRAMMLAPNFHYAMLATVFGDRT